VLELTYRSLSGLLERFHHSYFLYILLSPDRFATVEVYLVPVVCFLLALALQVIFEIISFILTVGLMNDTKYHFCLSLDGGGVPESRLRFPAGAGAAGVRPI